MAAGHALRGAATAWLGLIALQVATTTGGSGRVSGALSGLSSLISRALDPRVPAIPDRRAGAAPAGPSGPITPAQAAAAARASAAAGAVAGVTGPGGALSGLPSLNTYVHGGGLPAGIADNPALIPPPPGRGVITHTAPR